MSVTSKSYGYSSLNAFSGKINLTSDTINVMLTTSSYTPNQDTDQWKSDVTNEVTGTGYSAGGMALSGITLTYTAGTHTVVFAASNVTWSSSTITARTAVVYDATPSTDATRPLLCYAQSSVDITTSGQDFVIVWNAAGIINLVNS